MSFSRPLPGGADERKAAGGGAGEEAA